MRWKKTNSYFFFVFLESLGFNFDNKLWNLTITYLWESPVYHNLPHIMVTTVDEQFMWIVPFYKPPVIQTPTWTDQVSIESLERRMATKTPQKGPFLKHTGHKCGFVHSVSFESNLKVGDFYSSQQKYNNNQWMKTYLDTILPKSSGEGRSQRQLWAGLSEDSVINCSNHF